MMNLKFTSLLKTPLNKGGVYFKYAKANSISDVPRFSSTSLWNGTKGTPISLTFYGALQSTRKFSELEQKQAINVKKGEIVSRKGTSVLSYCI